MGGKPAIYTIGHSTHLLEAFIAILKHQGIECLADVRTIPRSRTNPRYNKDSLPAPLQGAGISYVHIAALGGLRSRRKADGESANTYWENKSFRNYADYAMSAAFRQGLDELEALALHGRCAIMCAEAVWWRCHRRIIADYLIAEQYPVYHIMGPDKADPARMTDAAQVLGDGTIRYK